MKMISASEFQPDHPVSRPWVRGRTAAPLGKASQAAIAGAVSAAVDAALDWATLQARMDDAGLSYYPTGGGLIVIDAQTGEVIAKASDVGPSYGTLVRRFGAALPGHPNPDLAAEALAR